MKKWEGYQHGVNLGGWLSQCDHTKERYDGFIKEADVELIGSWGLDHLRLPIDYDLVEDKDGNYSEEGFSYIDKTIEWCRKHGLNMILDIHKTYGFSFDEGEHEKGFFDNEDYQERFYRLWEEFARRYGNIGERVSFELLNEVTDKEFCDRWNIISERCIERIRKIAPKVKILVGGYYNNSIVAIPDLLPPHDENVIYNFHCYDPLIFTHQGAYWCPGMDTGFRLSIDEPYRALIEKTKEMLTQVTADFPDFDENDSLSEAYFEQLFAEAVKTAEERGAALYCGEYGVINLADPEDTLKWYQMIGNTFDKYGIGRAAWSFREMDFGLVDPHMSGVRDEIIKVM